MSKKKTGTILTEDLFNANGNTDVSQEILNESIEKNETEEDNVENTEIIDNIKEDVNEIKDTTNDVKVEENEVKVKEKPVSIKNKSNKKISGFNDEMYYYENLN